MTRVARPWFSIASCRARELITVPNMPMRSEFARFIPASSPVAPRQMLPPPTTTASSRPPRSMAAAISIARKSPVDASMVSSLAAEANASPESFNTIRRTIVLSPDDYLSVRRYRRTLQELSHRFFFVLYVGLIQEDAVLVPTIESTFEDLGDRGFGLALVAGDLFDGLSLGLHRGRRHVLATEVLGLGESNVESQFVRYFFARALDDHDDRVHAPIGLNVLVGVDYFTRARLESIDPTDGDVLLEGREHRVDVLLEVGHGLIAVRHDGGRAPVSQCHELLGLRDKVRLAAQFHDGRDVAVTHDGNRALARFAARALLGRGETLDSQQADS